MTQRIKVNLIEENKIDSSPQQKNMNPGVSMYLRGIKKLQRKAEKLRDLKEMEQRKLTKDCTFKPNIKPKTARVSRSSGRDLLPIEDRLIIFEEDKQTKVARMRQIVDELENLECTFKPRINQ
jgi:hypothetical protein